MATKIFEVGEMACEDVQAWVRAVKFGTLSGSTFTPADVDDGMFVVLGDHCDDTTYTGEKDWNLLQASVPTAATLTAEEVAVIDIDDRGQGIITGNNYKVSSKLVDLKVRAGYPVRCRLIKKHDMFWLGAGNFESTPTVGNFAKLTANKGTLTPAASVTAGQLNLKIVASKPMVIGAHVPTAGSAFEQEYLVQVL